MTLADAELPKETKGKHQLHVQEILTVNFVLKRHKYVLTLAEYYLMSKASLKAFCL